MHYVQERVGAQIMSVKHEPTDTNLADMLTKIQVGSKRLELAGCVFFELWLFVILCFTLIGLMPWTKWWSGKIPSGQQHPKLGTSQELLRLPIPATHAISFRGQLRWIRASPKSEWLNPYRKWSTWSSLCWWIGDKRSSHEASCVLLSSKSWIRRRWQDHWCW